MGETEFERVRMRGARFPAVLSTCRARGAGSRPDPGRDAGRGAGGGRARPGGIRTGVKLRPTDPAGFREGWDVNGLDEDERLPPYESVSR